MDLYSEHLKGLTDRALNVEKSRAIKGQVSLLTTGLELTHDARYELTRDEVARREQESLWKGSEALDAHKSLFDPNGA